MVFDPSPSASCTDQTGSQCYHAQTLLNQNLLVSDSESLSIVFNSTVVNQKTSLCRKLKANNSCMTSF